MSNDWMAAKALKMMQREINDQSITRSPNDWFGFGMLEAFYALDLFDDERHASLSISLETAVRNRRSELAAERIAARKEAI